MRALITGASSGIGRDMAKYLSSLGYELILVSRDEEKLKEVQKQLKTTSEVIPMDLSVSQNCINLYEQVKNKDIDLLINNAGFGLFGEFNEIDLEKEIHLINTNITALHILTKLFLKDMIKKDKGHILNVSSVASFAPGPLMSSYYASKSYVTRLSRGIAKELEKKKSKVKISILCPGPVNTNFNKTAGVKFSIKPMSSEYVAKYAIQKTLKGKLIIIPGFKIKCLHVLSKLAPEKIVAEFAYHNQTKKM